MPAPTPIATPEDASRFKDVHEDWSTPALTKGELKPVPPLIATLEEKTDRVVQLIQVQWRAADPIDLYVIKPKGIAKPPVIMWLYGFPSDTDSFKDETFQKLVTADGFAVVGFMTALTGHRFHDRPMNAWFVSELQEALASSAHDVQMVLDYLDSRNDLDMSRVGLFGQGSGGTIGILAAAVDPRIKVLDTLDPWGDWPNWLAKSSLVPDEERVVYSKPEFLQKVAPLDPIVWLPKLHARTFRLEETAFGPVTPKVCRDKIKSALPDEAKTVDYETSGELEQAANGKILQWMKAELAAINNSTPSLKPETKPENSGSR